MYENVYAEKLTWFKQNEKPETVLLVADKPECVRLVIAWANLNVKRTEKLTELKSELENDIWEWLWENTDYSRAELKEKSGISYEIALENMMRPLIGNRVIYPDGTMNSYVQRYLREQVVKLFEVKPKKSVKKS